ncbi:MAG: translation initiation factor IF-3 [Armatimonadetes bacterium]|nr:translation initiation factor IF-3 [Armatimonadota bacterium]
MNEEIRARDVRLIDADGAQKGVMPFREALKIAQEQELDLVEVSPQGDPPVCRILDFGKFKYSQSKKDKEVKKKRKGQELKEVKLRPKIDPHDFVTKSKMVQRLLKEGDKVKVTIMFRGREVAYATFGEKILEKVAEESATLATIERKPKLEGKNMIMILTPKGE